MQRFGGSDGKCTRCVPGQKMSRLQSGFEARTSNLPFGIFDTKLNGFRRVSRCGLYMCQFVEAWYMCSLRKRTVGCSLTCCRPVASGA